MLCGSYMGERMGMRAKELQVEKAAMEEAMAKEEVLGCSGRCCVDLSLTAGLRLRARRRKLRLRGRRR